MNNEKPRMRRPIPAKPAWAILAMAGLAIGLASSGPAAQPQRSPRSVTVQWQPQSIVETKLLAKVEADNKLLIDKLMAMAAAPDSQDPEEWAKAFSGTYLRSPRLWTDDPAPNENWPNVFNRLRQVLRGVADIHVDALHVLIEYLPPVEGSDLDLRARIKLTFSLSSGEDPILEGTLCHRKICTWEPCAI